MGLNLSSITVGIGIVIILALISLLILWKKRSNHYRHGLHHSQTDLMTGGENLRRIFESIKDYAIFTYNRDHTITSWNPGVQRVLGYSQDEFIGQNIDMIFGAQELAEGVAEKEIARALAEGSSVTEGIRKRKNGRQFWGSGIVRPLVSHEGQVEGFIKVLQDLTGRRQLEESLEEAKHSAEEANRAKDEFIAVLSHELRSPLTPISIAVDGLEYESQSENSKMFTEMIRRNLALELRLIDDLLDVTRIARGKLAIKVENFDARLKIEETVEILKSDIQERHLHLRKELTALHHHILADPARFQQIMWNLLRNAIKFTSEHGIITIRSWNEGGQLMIQVIDTGIGMDQETMERIFRPFTQGMPNIARKYGGLGLGLTIARALTETFTGKLSASSDGPGKGTTFTIELPVVEPPSNSLDKREDATQMPLHYNARILLIDDQTDARIALGELLRARGYAVDAVENIAQAINLVERSSYDLILCDIQLEGESGWDLLPLLPKPVPAIALTALGTPSNIETSFRVGFVDHIVKPFRLNDLDAKIQEVLSKRHKSKNASETKKRKLTAPV
jgi:PAS domain S-box-containing protein